MGNFTRNTFNKLKHYVGVRLQQGVPILDADWNEQEDIRKHELQTFLKWFVGNGVPQGNDGFRITQIAGGGVGTIVLTSNKKIIDLSSIVIDLEASTAAEALGFGPDNYSASRLGSSPARLVGNLSEPFTLEEGMKLVMSTDGQDKEEVTFQASDFKDIRAAVSAEVVTAINNTVENFTASVGQGNDFIITGGTEDQPGRCLVEGWDVMIEGDIRYAEQPLYDNDPLAQKWDVEPLGVLSPPAEGEGDRTDLVYLDVWEREVGAADDIDLVHPDIKIETCVRLKREWVVRVAEGVKELPAPPEGHVYYEIAKITRNANEKTISNIEDVRQTCLSLPGIKEYIDFKTMAAQVGAITAINNVENPGGNIELVGDNAIDIIPDEELPKIKISELHSPRTNNPHQTTARQVGALVSVGGVRNPGGDVYLRHDKSITITPDDEANSITISETHSSLTGNPHGTTAGDVEALSITGGTVNGNLTVDGKVGIGTTNPGFKFVTSTDVAEWTAKILNTNSAAYGLSIENINSTAGYGLAVYTGSGTGFFVRNNGCVGIGTNDPKEKLHVNGSVRGNVNGALRIGTGNGYVDIGPQNTGFSHFQTDRPAFYFNKEIVVYSGFIGTYDENLQLRTSRTTRMIIRSDNGNVGIGTDPGEKLHINGSVRGNISGALRISTGHGYVDIGPKHPCCAHFYTDRPLYYFDKEIIVDTGCIGSHSEDLQLRTASTTRMTIRIDNGNVGIGTTEPKGKLDVNGQVVYQGVIGDNIYWDSAKRHWTYAKEGAGYALRNDGNGNLEFRFAPKGSPGDNAGPGTRVIFTNSGNVGIGTASPGTTLEVRNGTLRVSGGASHGQDSARLVIDPGPSWGHCFFECRNVNGVMYRIYGDGSTNARYVSSGSSDYAEYFESKNGKEIKPGTSVVLEDSKIRSAKKNEIPIGVISASPGIVGGVHIEWPKRYLKDEFGKVIMEEYKEEILVPKKEKVKKERQKMEKKKVKEKVKRTEVVKKKGKYYQVEVEETVERDIEEPVFKEVDLYDDVSKKKIGKHKIPVMETYEEEIDVLDDKGQPVMVGSGKFETKTSPKINPDYDEKKEYIPREKRPEWNCVGLLGQLPLRKGQPVAPTWIKIKDISKDVELWLVK